MEAQMQRQPVCYFLLHITSVVFFPIVVFLTFFLLNPPLQVANRAPRKQSLGPLSDISQQEPLRSAVPPGLTGDIFKDTELVEAKVRDLCRRVNLGEPEKEKLRLALMTKGLDAVTVDMTSGAVRVGGGGRGRPARGRGAARSAGGARISRPAAARTIKCDQCKKEFPANVDESVLVHHIKTAHMVKPQEVTHHASQHTSDITAYLTPHITP